MLTAHVSDFSVPFATFIKSQIKFVSSACPKLCDNRVWPAHFASTAPNPFRTAQYVPIIYWRSNKKKENKKGSVSATVDADMTAKDVRV